MAGKAGKGGVFAGVVDGDVGFAADFEGAGQLLPGQLLRGNPAERTRKQTAELSVVCVRNAGVGYGPLRPDVL